jgi:hypothetical protein
MTYRTQNKETGAPIEEFDNLLDAQIAIAEYEHEDRLQGTYTEDFYEVAYQIEDEWITYKE